MILRSFGTILFIFISLLSLGQAPTLFNSGLIFVNDSAEVHVFGNVVTDGANSLLEHKGFIQTYTSTNQGNFELQNLGNVHSTGNFMIQNDWINNGYLLIDTGDVDMYGDNQWFLGDSVSRFWNLWLTGTNIKEQGQHIRVRNELDLNDLELAVHDKIAFIDNSSTTCINYDNTFGLEGIISTDEDGQVRKILLQGQTNLIPLGSSQGNLKRHRPVKAVLLAGSEDTLYATFHHHTPDLLGALESDMDTSLCKIQNRYFYTINSASPTNNFQLDFATYFPNDGYYPDLAQWYNPTWKAVYNHMDYSDVNYHYVRGNDENNFIKEHYTLAYFTPVAPYMLYDSTECYDIAQYQVETPLGQPWYEWTVDNNHNASSEIAQVIEGQGTSTATIDWQDNIGGWVYVQYIDTAGCWSHTDSAEVTDVSIDASFVSSMDFTDDFNTTGVFVNQSSSNTDEIQWSFNDETSGWLTGWDMDHFYAHTFSGNGETQIVEVMLVAYDSDFGCYDTMIQVITIPSTFVFYAPNSFTPNGDEFNNTFYAQGGGIQSAEMSIYNRWGELIFNQYGYDLEEMIWDGTYKGQYVPVGSYIYQFKIVPVNYNAGEQGALIYTGNVSVLR